MSEATTAAATGAEATTTTATGTEAAAGAETQDVASLPEWARASLKKANDEAAKFRTQVRDLAPKAAKLDELTEAQKTEQQKAAEKAAADERRAVEAETRLLRYEVAAAKSLPADLVQFLTGTTQDDIEKQADALIARVGAAAQTQVPSFDGGAATTAASTDMNAAIRKAAGR